MMKLFTDPQTPKVRGVSDSITTRLLTHASVTLHSVMTIVEAQFLNKTNESKEDRVELSYESCIPQVSRTVRAWQQKAWACREMLPAQIYAVTIPPC